MPAYDDDDGMYTIGPDRTRKYGTMTNFSINGQNLYEFDTEAGVLRVSMSEGDLELFLADFCELPPEGEDLILPTPMPGISGPARFHGVKRIESTGEEPYLMSISRVSAGDEQ